MQTKEVLVIGGNGYVGNLIAGTLAKFGYKVIRGIRGEFTGTTLKNGILFFNDPQQLISIKNKILPNISVVINCTGINASHKIKELKESLDSSKGMIDSLLELSKMGKVVFHFSTSIANFHNKFIKSDKNYLYSQLNHIQDDYILNEASAINGGVTILRPTTIYGKKISAGTLLDDIVKQAIAKSSISVFNACVLKDYIHIEDICSRMLILEKNGTTLNPITLASFKPIDVYDIANYLSQILNREIKAISKIHVQIKDFYYPDNLQNYIDNSIFPNTTIPFYKGLIEVING